MNTVVEHHQVKFMLRILLRVLVRTDSLQSNETLVSRRIFTDIMK